MLDSSVLCLFTGSSPQFLLNPSSCPLAPCVQCDREQLVVYVHGVSTLQLLSPGSSSLAPSVQCVRAECGVSGHRVSTSAAA